MKENYIFDFDGTLTNVEKDTADWQQKYPLICAKMLDINPNFILPKYNRIKKDLANHPEKGFIIMGYDVLPANSDPYIRCQAAIQGLFHQVMSSKYLDIDLKLPENETDFLIKAFAETFKVADKTIYFRQGVKDFLEDVRSKYNVVIVTNSKVERVGIGLEELLMTDIPIFGNAKKLFIDKKLQDSMPAIKPKGFPREVLLGRKGYLDILNKLSKENNFLPENTTVVGDIYELDLALPDFLGYSKIQINNGSAAEHEKKYLGENFVEDLDGLRKLIL